MAAADAAMERLPPGVYFNPSPEECVTDYLLPWARGEQLPEMGRYIHEQSVYAQGPDALRRARAPGTTRAFEPKWYFLSRRNRRGGRAVATGGTWAVEQKQRVLLEAGGDDGDVPGGTRKSYGFFVGKKKKTPWLMEEFTAGDSGGGGEEEDSEEVPVLCRVYVSPRATTDEKRAIFGEDGVAVDANKKKKPERVVIPADHFDALKNLLTARVSTGASCCP
ncbi:hypothetical protein EJB05_13169, partial [Eragrostis curvula]